MIFNYSKIVLSATKPQARSGVSLYLFDDSDKLGALLLEDLEVLVKIPTSSIGYAGLIEKRIVVPKDAYTDFASCPRLIWSFFAPIGKHTRAAIVHDYLYTTGRVSREEADFVFRQLMCDCTVGFTKRWLMWAAVRLFGGSRWKGKTKCVQCNRTHNDMVWIKGRRNVQVYLDDLGVCQICRLKEQPNG